MDENTRILIQVRLNKSRQDLKYARILYQKGGYRQAVNRAYYAAFALATATLLTLDIERRKHSGVESAFNQYLVKTGLIEPEYADIYRRARRWREDADYDDFATFTQADVESILEEVERLIMRLERYLRSVGALDTLPTDQDVEGVHNGS